MMRFNRLMSCLCILLTPSVNLSRVAFQNHHVLKTNTALALLISPELQIVVKQRKHTVSPLLLICSDPAQDHLRWMRQD